MPRRPKPAAQDSKIVRILSATVALTLASIVNCDLFILELQDHIIAGSAGDASSSSSYPSEWSMSRMRLTGRGPFSEDGVMDWAGTGADGGWAVEFTTAKALEELEEEEQAIKFGKEWITKDLFTSESEVLVSSSQAQGDSSTDAVRLLGDHFHRSSGDGGQGQADNDNGKEAEWLIKFRADLAMPRMQLVEYLSPSEGGGQGQGSTGKEGQERTDGHLPISENEDSVFWMASSDYGAPSAGLLGEEKKWAGQKELTTEDFCFFSTWLDSSTQTAAPGKLPCKIEDRGIIDNANVASEGASLSIMHLTGGSINKPPTVSSDCWLLHIAILGLLLGIVGATIALRQRVRQKQMAKWERERFAMLYEPLGTRGVEDGALQV